MSGCVKRMEYTPAMLTLLLLIIDLVLVSGDSCQPIVKSLQRYGSVYTYNSICYVFVNHEKTWVDARHQCESWGGDMVHIPDEGTMNFLIDRMDNQLRWRNNGVWIGLHNRGGGAWKWTTGDSQTYSYWEPGQPSRTLGFLSFEDCANMRRGDRWRWHDYMCDNRMFTYKYICQFRIPTTTTTTTTTTIATTTMTTTTIATTAMTTTAMMTKAPTVMLPIPKTSTQRDMNIERIIHATVYKSIHQPSDSSIGVQVANNIERSRQEKDDGLSDTSKGAIIGLVLGGFVVLAIVGMIFILFRRRRRKSRQSDDLVMQFENTDYMRGYTQGYTPVSQNDHVTNNGRPESHMYMDTNEMNRLYEQVTKEVNHGVNRYDQLKPKGAEGGVADTDDWDCDLKKPRVDLPEEPTACKLNNENEYIDMSANRPKLTNLQANMKGVEKQNNVKESEPIYSNESYQDAGLTTPNEDELAVLDYEESNPLDNGQLQVLDYDHEDSHDNKTDPLYDTVH